MKVFLIFVFDETLFNSPNILLLDDEQKPKRFYNNSDFIDEMPKLEYSTSNISSPTNIRSITHAKITDAVSSSRTTTSKELNLEDNQRLMKSPLAEKEKRFTLSSDDSPILSNLKL